MSIHWVGMRSRNPSWLTSRTEGSASLNVFLAIAVIAICIVGWRLVASSTGAPSVAKPEGSQSPPSLATPPGEPTLRTPVAASSPAAALPTAEGDAGAQVAESTPQKPVLDQETWKQSFANASVHEILAASEALNAEVQEKAGPILESMRVAGQSEYVGPETKYEGRTSDHEVIFRVYMEQGKGTYRMELPRAQYPEIYALKERALWLEELARKKQQG